MRGRPVNMRRMVEELVILTLLAWATQTLVSQWGFGAEPEKFIAARPVYRAVVVELKSEATIAGSEVRLKQVARWPESDASAMEQTGELVVMRFERGKAMQDLDVEQVRRSLEEAGVNLAGMNIAGALSCRVKRNDPRLEVALEQAVAVNVQRLMPATRPAESSTVVATAESGPNRTLKEILIAELAQRLGLAPEQLEVRFSPQDEKLANLSEPQFAFEISPSRQRKLGDVGWEVLLSASAGKQKVNISGYARAWQTLVFATRPIVVKQLLRDEDLASQRVLVDRLAEDMPLKKEQIIGQQASRDITAGMQLNAKMIEPVQLAHVGQLINVSVQQGRVELKWVAEAREIGCYGQTIRVRKPGTREEFNLLLTGPQEAKLVGSVGAPVAVNR